MQSSYEASNQTHYRLIKVDKQSFFADMQQRLTAKLALFSGVDSKNTSEQLTRLLQFNQQRQALFADLYLLQAYQQPVDALATQLRQRQQRFLILAQNTKIDVINSASDLADAVTERLQKSGFLLFDNDPQSPKLRASKSGHF